MGWSACRPFTLRPVLLYEYGFNDTLAGGVQDFFRKRYDANVDFTEIEDKYARQLALPCYFIDHAEGFAKVTVWLAHNHKGHITEDTPVKFKWKHMHLTPPDFVVKCCCKSWAFVILRRLTQY